jgi:hypothetical protein
MPFEEPLLQKSSNLRSSSLREGDSSLSVCLFVNFYIFDFSRTTGPILTRLGTNHPWGRGFKFVQMKEITLLKGEIIAKEYKNIEIFKKSSPEPLSIIQSNLVQIILG